MLETENYQTNKYYDHTYNFIKQYHYSQKYDILLKLYIFIFNINKFARKETSYGKTGKFRSRKKNILF